VPLALVLIGVGFTMLLASQSRRIRAVTALVGVGVIVGAIHTSYSSLMRFRDAAYYLDRAARVGVAQVPTNKVVELEGFGEGPVPITEQGLIYMLAEERDWGKVSLPDDYNEGGSLIYLGGGGFPLDSPQFIPSYTYVLTRLPDVATHRQTIWRVGGIALQRRTGRFDVTPDYGLSIPYLRLNPTGAAYGSYYQVEPIKFIVTGKSTKPVYVNVQVVHALATPPKITTPGAPLARIQKNGITTWVCVEAVGTSPIRTAYIQYEPSTVVQLKSMAATTTPCKG
jgi:hypothetical protein